jgi:predicted phosphodiesterase
MSPTQVFRVITHHVAHVIGIVAAIACVLAVGSFIAAHVEVAGVMPPSTPLTAESLPQRLPTQPPRSWCFAVLGDPEENRTVFRACLDSARKANCAFVVITGDIVKRESLLSFAQVMKDLDDHGYGRRVATVRGNHDARWLYGAYFGSSNWSFEYGGVRFVGLDDQVSTDDSERRAFAASSLRRSGAQRLVLFVHRPVLPCSGQNERATRADDASNTGDDRDLNWLAELCVETPVDFILSSHLHAYRRCTLGSTTEVVSGAAGGNPQESFDGWNYLIADVLDGVITVRREDIADPPGSALYSFIRMGVSLDQDLHRKPVRSAVLWGSILAVALLGCARPCSFRWIRRQ